MVEVITTTMEDMAILAIILFQGHNLNHKGHKDLQVSLNQTDCFVRFVERVVI